MNIYYVYMYLREYDSDTAKAGTPYYIGRGKLDRATQKHPGPGNLELRPRNSNNIVLYKENLSLDESKVLEIELIKKYGRVIDGSGILRNQTLGGEGIRGYIHNEETKERISKKHLGKKMSIESIERGKQTKKLRREAGYYAKTIRKVSNYTSWCKGKIISELGERGKQIIENMSRGQKRRFQNPEQRKKLNDLRKKASRSRQLKLKRLKVCFPDKSVKIYKSIIAFTLETGFKYRIIVHLVNKHKNEVIKKGNCKGYIFDLLDPEIT